MATDLDIPGLLADLNSFVGGGLSPRLAFEPADTTVIKVSGAIVDANGEAVGDTVRRYSVVNGEWKAMHTRLHLEKAFRGLGFGRLFLRHSEEVYRRHGIRLIEIFAQDKGGYAWQGEGFRLVGPLEHRRKQWVEIWEKGGRERAAEARVAGQITQQQFDAVEDEFARVNRRERDPMEPYEIAQFGLDQPWRDGDGHKIWLGRMILTGSCWTGVKKI